MGCFLKPSWGDLDKELSEWDEGDQRQDLHLHQPTKGSFLPTPGGKPTPCPIHPNKIHCPLSSNRNPSGNPGARRRNQGTKPETPNHRGRSLRRAPSPWAEVGPSPPTGLHLPHPKCLKDLLNDFLVFHKTDDLHPSLTFRTSQGTRPRVCNFRCPVERRSSDLLG